MIRRTSLLFPILYLPLMASEQVAQLDAYWFEGGRTVAEGDFEGYSATYHPDAVLVSMASSNSYPIADALAGWKPGFDDTKAGKQSAGVELRFSQRLLSETTAHETGIFRYHFTPEGGEEFVQHIHLAALLVKKGTWLMMMEYQKTPATQSEWDALSGQ